jgi:hypothetical protein
MSQHVQIGLRDIGIAVIDDISRHDLFYITINKSKEIWTEFRKGQSRPLSRDLNNRLEEHYKSYVKHYGTSSGHDEASKKKYHLDDKRVQLRIGETTHHLPTIALGCGF